MNKILQRKEDMKKLTPWAKLQQLEKVSGIKHNLKWNIKLKIRPSA